MRYLYVPVSDIEVPIERLTMYILVLLLMMIPAFAEAADINATTCSSAHVQSAIDSASDGDRVIVPAGSCTWTTTVTILNKSITLEGAGIGNTTITGNASGEDAGLLWTTKATGNSPAGFSRLTGFTWTSTAGCSFGDTAAPVHIKGVTANFRADHNRFLVQHCQGIHVNGSVRGVIDHNTIDKTTSGYQYWVPVEHETWLGSGSDGDNSWAQDSTMGTADALYMEDNVITCTGGSGGVGGTNDFIGARTVYRFNAWTDCNMGNHGTESGGRLRGFRHVEAYRQTFNWTFVTAAAIGVRGGTGMFFDNKSTGQPVNFVVDVNTYRRDSNATGSGYYVWGGCGEKSITSITRSGSTATVTTPSEHLVQGSGSWVIIAGAGQAEYNITAIGTRTSATTFTYTVSGTPATPATGTITHKSPFDGNTDSTGYPCLDQAGRGKSITYTGYGPTEITPVSPGNNLQEPIYTWNNTVGGTLSAANINLGQGDFDIIQYNRDLYNQNNSYNGTTQRGVGRGTRASRPTTCTTGDAWWATDQGTWNTSTTETFSSSPGEDGVLDKCTGTNTWTNAFYTPYTYPHTLVSGGSPPPATATITAPSGGSTQVASSSFAVTFTATAGSGSITRVDVYINGVATCADTVAPFTSCNAAAPAIPGTYTLTAKATDSGGLGTASSGVTFTVPPPRTLRLR